jgi:hypothetical protein
LKAVLDAERFYEQATRSARANDFIHNEALANELASFYAARGFEKIARVYLDDARYGYLRWGAYGTVTQLDKLYSFLRQDEPVLGPTSTIREPVEHLASSSQNPFLAILTHRAALRPFHSLSPIDHCPFCKIIICHVFRPVVCLLVVSSPLLPRLLAPSSRLPPRLTPPDNGCGSTKLEVSPRIILSVRLVWPTISEPHSTGALIDRGAQSADYIPRDLFAGKCLPTHVR